MSVAAQALIAGGALSAVAAVAHLACIALGAPAYRFMGAGERMARAAEADKLRPTLITFAIAALLFLWAAYAFSGGGIITRLPFTKAALAGICFVYLTRAFCFPLLRPAFPENSNTFWLVSSSVCLVLGLLYTFGTVSLWATL